MKILHKKVGNDIYVYLEGELDEYAATSARSQLDNLIETHNMRAFIFELSKLTFMDSTGIGMLIGRYKKLNSRNIPVYVSNVNQQLEKIFTVSGLYEIMPKANF